MVLWPSIFPVSPPVDLAAFPRWVLLFVTVFIPRLLHNKLWVFLGISSLGLFLRISLHSINSAVFPERKHRNISNRKIGRVKLFVPYLPLFCVEWNSVLFRSVYPILPDVLFRKALLVLERSCLDIWGCLPVLLSKDRVLLCGKRFFFEAFHIRVMWERRLALFRTRLRKLSKDRLLNSRILFVWIYATIRLMRLWRNVYVLLFREFIVSPIRLPLFRFEFVSYIL